MTFPYVGEIRMFAGNFAPVDWAFCDGRLLSIDEYDALFLLIGKTYGGDGESNFAVPDLRGRIPIHQSNADLGQSGGVETVTLTLDQMPAHTHTLVGSATNALQSGPQNNVLASSALMRSFVREEPLTAMAGTAILPVGSGQPHTNMQPFLCVNFIIALAGVFPIQA